MILVFFMSIGLLFLWNWNNLRRGEQLRRVDELVGEFCMNIEKDVSLNLDDLKVCRLYTSSRAFRSSCIRFSLRRRFTYGLWS